MSASCHCVNSVQATIPGLPLLHCSELQSDVHTAVCRFMLDGASSLCMHLGMAGSLQVKGHSAPRCAAHHPVLSQILAFIQQHRFTSAFLAQPAVSCAGTRMMSGGALAWCERSAGARSEFSGHCWCLSCTVWEAPCLQLCTRRRPRCIVAAQGGLCDMECVPLHQSACVHSNKKQHLSAGM